MCASEFQWPFACLALIPKSKKVDDEATSMIQHPQHLPSFAGSLAARWSLGQCKAKGRNWQCWRESGNPAWQGKPPVSPLTGGASLMWKVSTFSWILPSKWPSLILAASMARQLGSASTSEHTQVKNARFPWKMAVIHWSRNNETIYLECWANATAVANLRVKCVYNLQFPRTEDFLRLARWYA